MGSLWLQIIIKWAWVEVNFLHLFTRETSLRNFLYVIELFVVLSSVFRCFGFRSPLSPMFWFVAMFLIICVSLWRFTNEVEDTYAVRLYSSLRKQAYSNILLIKPPKNWKKSDKNIDIFHISAQNIGCGYSLEPPRRVEKRNKNLYPCKPQFYYIKVGFKGVNIIQACFRYV